MKYNQDDILKEINNKTNALYQALNILIAFPDYSGNNAEKIQESIMNLNDAINKYKLFAGYVNNWDNIIYTTKPINDIIKNILNISKQVLEITNMILNIISRIVTMQDVMSELNVNDKQELFHKIQEYQNKARDIMENKFDVNFEKLQNEIDKKIRA